MDYEEYSADDLIECSQCGADVFEDSPRCPHCGQWITTTTSPWSNKPLWWVLLGLIGIVALTAALMVGF